MRKFWLLCAALAWPCPAEAAAVEAPLFAPLPRVPSYIATYVQKPIVGSPGGSRTVTYHRGWTRIDSAIDGQRSTTAYFGPASQYFTMSRQTPRLYEQLSVGRVPAKDASGQSERPSKTGKRETFLGERCEIWTVPEKARHVPNRQSCITRDGIELWNRPVVGISGQSYEITSLKRKRVAPRDVRPPVERFDVKWWLALPTVAVAPPPEPPRDVTVVMQPEQSGTPDRPVLTSTMMRRRHPWTFTEEPYTPGLTARRYSYDPERLTITVIRNAAGEAMGLHIMKWLADTGRPKPQKLDRIDTILGEQCTWFNMHPDMMDASYIQCLTDDGVMLKDMHGGREGIRVSRSAVSLSREPVPLDAVMPPPAILAHKTWGIPD
jgi:hypothetical protein